MHVRRVSPALQERLGEEGTQGLLEMFDEARHDWTADVMDRVGERFERRLVEETSAIRVEMARMRGDLRQEIAQLGSDLRQEMAQLGSDLRQEMAQLGSDLRREMSQMRADSRQEIAGVDASLRQEMAAGFAAMRQDMAEQRFELLKWAFLFWIGQFFALASLVAIVIRYVNPG
jgi:cell division septum initiation protein DivIVA